MAIDERVAALEARVNEQSQTLAFFRETFGRIEQRFTAVDQRFDAVDRRFDAVDRRFDAVEARLARLEDTLSTQFLWTVGIQITILVAVLGALLARR